MTTMTLRGIDETIAAALKDKARREGISLFKRSLKVYYGIEYALF